MQLAKSKMNTARRSGCLTCTKCSIAVLITLNCVLLLVHDQQHLTGAASRITVLLQGGSKSASKERQVNESKTIAVKFGPGNVRRAPQIIAAPNFRFINQPMRAKPVVRPVNERFLRNFSQVQQIIFCSGSLVVYDKEFLRLRNTTLNTLQAFGPAGGEPVASVMGRSEDDEYFKMEPGVFQVYCPNASASESGTALSATVSALFHELNTIIKLTKALKASPTETNSGVRVTRTTLVLARYEYANLCHSLTYFYNAFLMARFFQVEHDDLDVLLVDAHAAGNLDDVWDTLFGQVSRLGQQKNKTLFYSDMIWSPQGYDSPLLEHRAATPPPLLEEFRQFVLFRFSIPSERALNCSCVGVTVVFRRNYVAHPRNPTGKVLRRISNEDNLLSALRSNTHLQGRVNVTGVQLETLNMREQLLIAAQTDVLVGMHGAGMSHILFLPRHGALVELFPRFFPFTLRFPAFARWRKMPYFNWRNDRSRGRTKEQELEVSEVDTSAVAERVKLALQRICP